MGRADGRPRVSIVTPTLQRAGFLEHTLRSVRAQTYSNVEHIVVDGGSTDGTLELLLQYGPTYNLRWLSEPDAGIYDAVNKGMREATGDVLAYLNSDDRYFPWSVESAVAALGRHPRVDLVFGDVMRFDEMLGTTVPVFQPPLNAHRMAAFGTLFQPTVFMRREMFDRLDGFDSDLKFVGDLDFWLRGASTFRFAQLSEFLALEHRHPGMLSVTAMTAMEAEDRRLRDANRTGLWKTRIAPLVGQAEWHAWSALRWLRFVGATRGRGRGWGQAIRFLRPHIPTSVAIQGLLPSKGSRYRAHIRWETDPRALVDEP